MIKVGDSIKKFRELKDITREDMASRLNMSLSNYGKIERDEIDLTLSRIEQIAGIFETDISQLLNFDASQVFNISNNKLVQGVGAKAETIHFYGDDYKEKYIKLLEEENQRLKEPKK